MPRYQVECVDRDTGQTAMNVFEATNPDSAMRIAAQAGFVVGSVVLEPPPEPLLPISTFRPTFRRHLTPEIARSSATAGIVIAVMATMFAGAAPIAGADDPSSPGAWMLGAASALAAAVVFGLLAVQIRLWAELASILFDIYRLVREIKETSRR